MLYFLIGILFGFLILLFVAFYYWEGFKDGKRSVVKKSKKRGRPRKEVKK